MTETTPNFYEVLGVAKDATPEQIKQAWRKASSAAHPDREGGSAERQQLVNRAYEVLSDAQRRKDYDANGVDNDAMSIEEEGRMQLMELFDRSASDERVSNVVKHVLNVLHGRVAEYQAEVAHAHKIISRLRRVRGRVKMKKKDGDNLFHMIVDKKIKNVGGTIPQNQRLQRVAEASLKILAEYESVDDGMDNRHDYTAQSLMGGPPYLPPIGGWIR